MPIIRRYYEYLNKYSFYHFTDCQSAVQCRRSNVCRRYIPETGTVALTAVLLIFTQPIISYNYGVGNARRVYSAVKRLVGSAFIITLIIYLVFMFASSLVIMPFTPDPELIELTVWGIRVYFATGVLIGIQMSLQQTLIALGKAGTASFLSLLRKVLLLIPFICVFPTLLDNKVFAIILAEPVAIDLLFSEPVEDGWRPLFCRIYTDEGIYGDGEAALSYGGTRNAAFGIMKDLAPMLIGMDPLDNEVIWQKMYRHCFLP